MSCMAPTFKGGSQEPAPPRMDPRTWRTFGQLEAVALHEDVPLKREFRLYGALPGTDEVAQFKKAATDRLSISSVEVDLSVVDITAPPFSALDFVPMGGASDPAWIETDVDPGVGEQLERGLYLPGDGQLVLRALGLFDQTYASVIVRGYARITPPVTAGYFVAGFAFNSRGEAIAGGIGQAITGFWYRRRAAGDPAGTLGLAGPIQLQTQVADPTTAPEWEPWTVHFNAQRGNGPDDGEAAYNAGGWRGFEASPPQGASGVTEDNLDIGWDHVDREVMIGASGAELLVQQISVHQRGL